ncbi:DNA polymerase [Elysia marginata]|uniref:DNA polymerase delta catalytic subunit n=1 Tax=Elysia marginata TaxID=1093978 RepID=A0AAV4GRE5_9GAST|nr:DNA polymerase [Elysia marginata]
MEGAQKSENESCGDYGPEGSETPGNESDEGPEEEVAAFELDADVGATASGPPPLRYDGQSQYISGLPTRPDLVRESDTTGLGATLETAITEGRTIFFLPNDVVEKNQYCHGRPVYKLHLFGALQDGSKTHVVLDGIGVYFDVRVPDAYTVAGFGTHLIDLLAQQAHAPDRVENIEAFPIRGYRKQKSAWKRLYFSNLQTRKEALELIRSFDYETASDDRTSYYRMAARVYGFVLTDWACLAEYKYSRGGGAHRCPNADADVDAFSPLCEHVFQVDVRTFKPLVDPMAAKTDQEQQEASKRQQNLRDKTLVLAWDIETYSTSKAGHVPKATYPTDHVFMICATVHWKDDPTPLRSICITDVDAEPDQRWQTIICGTETNVIKAFAVVYRHFAPDIITDFNGGNYDWPFVIEKARQLLCLSFMFDTMTALPRAFPSTERNVVEWHCHFDKKVKICAESSAFVTFIKTPGSVYIDVRVMFQQLFPKAEVGQSSSLAFYLKACNLSPKADMPHTRMWQIRATENAKQMRHVAHYCVNDAQRCQELLVKRNVVNDRREVAALSYVGLFDAIFYAGGHKVCNMLMAYASRRGFLCSNINNRETEGGKYPGAWVFHPEKGLVPDPTEGGIAALEAARAEYIAVRRSSPSQHAAATKAVHKALDGYRPGRPVTGLDFISLYPSIIMAYNLSPEKFVEDSAEACRLKAEGVDLHYTGFQYQGREICGWFVRHGNVAAEYGLYPAILIDLFNKRSLMKKKLAVQEGLKEHMECVLGSAKGAETGADAFPGVFADALAAQRKRFNELTTEAKKTASHKDAKRVEKEIAAVSRNIEYMEAIEAKPKAELQEAFRAQYRETCFEFAAIDSKQKALKGFMNTFYGEAGNQRSAFFLPQLAGGVTTAGQYNIKLVANFVLTKGFKIKYGDSVTGDTALVLRRGAAIFTARIDELVPETAWTPYHGGKEAAPTPGLEVWQDGGFTPVRRVIRHAHHSPLVRVLTHAGMVDCTTDHSLLRPDGTKVAPNALAVGDRLLHAGDAGLLDLLNEGNASGLPLGAGEAFFMGLFAASGSCGASAPRGAYFWTVDSSDRSLLAKARRLLPFPTKLVDTASSSGAAYALVPAKSVEEPALQFRGLFYNQHGEKRVPESILRASLDTVQKFWAGVSAGNNANCAIQKQSKEMAAGLWILGRRLGWTGSIEDRRNGTAGWVRLRFTPSGALPPQAAIKKITPLFRTQGAVYDLETASHHFHVGPGALVVHNTDSLYVCAPDHLFREADRRYAQGETTKEKYWSEMVLLTIDALDALRDQVNAHLSADNGTQHLQMAYEEVLYPVVFTGKKKYFGVAHLTVPNFRPKKLFVRGIDVVKQGQTELAKKIGHRIMWAAVALTNTKGLQAIVEEVLQEAVKNSKQWAFGDFVQSGAWKPSKDNKPVQHFIARMKIRVAEETAENARREARGLKPRKSLYYVPSPGERFRYVLVKPVSAFNQQGHKIVPKKGDVMEYAEVAQALELPIDVGKYLVSYVVGLCARFVNYAEQFLPPPTLRQNMDEKALDQKAQDAAKKHLTQLVAALQHGDSKTLSRRGYAYKRAWKKASQECLSGLYEQLGPAAEVIHGDSIVWSDFLPAETAVDALVSHAKAAAGKAFASVANAFLVEYCKRIGIGPDGSDLVPAIGAATASTSRRLDSVYAALIRPRRDNCQRCARAAALAFLEQNETAVRAQIAAAASEISVVAARYEARLAHAVSCRRAEEHRASPAALGPLEATPPLAQAPLLLPLSQGELECLEKVRRLWYQLVGIHSVRVQRQAVDAHLTTLRSTKRRQRNAARPDQASISRSIAASAKRFAPSGAGVIGDGGY